MTGTWNAKIKFIQLPVKPTSIEYSMPLSLTFTPDGNVTGRIGYATINPSKLKKSSIFARMWGNSSWQTRITYEGRLVDAADYLNGKGRFIFNTPENGLIRTEIKLTSLSSGKKAIFSVIDTSIQKVSE